MKGGAGVGGAEKRVGSSHNLKGAGTTSSPDRGSLRQRRGHSLPVWFQRPESVMDLGE